MLVMDFDKEVEKKIRFLQSNFNCMIMITRDENFYYMSVFYNETGKFPKDIKLCEADANKYKLMTAMRNAVKR